MNTWQIIIGTCGNHLLKAQNYPQLPLKIFYTFHKFKKKKIIKSKNRSIYLFENFGSNSYIYINKNDIQNQVRQ